MSKKLIVITGGIGSGKSSVMSLLESYGAITIYADKINQDLLIRSDYIALIKQYFPTAVINNRIDKSILRNIIINDESQRALLNSLAHPKIFEIIAAKQENYDNCNIFIEIPLLADAIKFAKFDYICVVKSPLKNRIERIMLRDEVSYDQALKIILAQQDQERLYDNADFIIMNDGDIIDLRKKVKQFYDDVR